MCWEYKFHRKIRLVEREKLPGFIWIKVYINTLYESRFSLVLKPGTYWLQFPLSASETIKTQDSIIFEESSVFTGTPWFLVLLKFKSFLKVKSIIHRFMHMSYSIHASKRSWHRPLVKSPEYWRSPQYWK